jgi:phage internal scaffolding protein
MSIALRKEKTVYKVRNSTMEPLKVATKVVHTPENAKQEKRTNQAFKESCNINTILKRYVTTGVIDHVKKYAPEYGEVSNLDFEEAFNLVKKSKEMFAELPAVVRENFGHRVENFLAYMENPENRNTESLLTTSASRNGTEERTADELESAKESTKSTQEKPE